MISATALQLSISWSCAVLLVLWVPAAWLAAMHWVAVAAACFDEFSKRLIIFLLMVVPTASLVVTLKWSAVLLSRSWLDSLPWVEAHCLAGATMSAVASARALAADNSRFCKSLSDWLSASPLIAWISSAVACARILACRTISFESLLPISSPEATMI